MKYPGDISGEAYAAMEDGYEQGRQSVREEQREDWAVRHAIFLSGYERGRDSMQRSRAEEGTLLEESDPRVHAAREAIRPMLPYDPDGPAEMDWRDVAEVVNAVLKADDMMAGER